MNIARMYAKLDEMEEGIKAGFRVASSLRGKRDFTQESELRDALMVVRNARCGMSSLLNDHVCQAMERAPRVIVEGELTRRDCYGRSVSQAILTAPWALVESEVKHRRKTEEEAAGESEGD